MIESLTNYVNSAIKYFICRLFKINICNIMLRTQSASKLSSKSVNKIKNTINAALGRLKQPMEVNKNKYGKNSKQSQKYVKRSESTRSLYSYKRISEKQLRNDRLFSTSTYSPSYQRSKDVKTGEAMKAITRILFNEKDQKFQRVKICNQMNNKKQKYKKRSIIDSQSVVKYIKSNGNINEVDRESFIKSYSWFHSENLALTSEQKQNQGKKLRYFAIKQRSSLVKHTENKLSKYQTLIGSIEDNYLYTNTSQCSYVLSSDKNHFRINDCLKSTQSQQNTGKILLDPKNIEFILIYPKNPEFQQSGMNISPIDIAKQIYSLKEDGVQSDQTILKIISRNSKSSSISHLYLLLIRLNKKKQQEQLSSKKIIDAYKRRMSKN